MASLGHVAVGMTAARLYRRDQPVRWSQFTSMLLWSVVSLCPDFDTIGFRFGVPYGSPWGHRGATHSLVFAVGLAAVLALALRPLRLPFRRTFCTAALVLPSHGLLDTLTDGGLGCALLWPFDDTRYFAPWQPIPVSPIGRAYLSEAGLRVALTELVQFSPLVVFALWPRKHPDPAKSDGAEPPAEG